MQDRNRKDIEVGDEVTVHFRVTALVNSGAEEKVRLETIHNQVKVQEQRGTAEKLAEVAVKADVPPISIETAPFRTILQRKAPKKASDVAAVPAPAGA